MAYRSLSRHPVGHSPFNRLRLAPALELRATELVLVCAFSEENLCAQRLEAVAAPQPVHHPNQAVQALGVGVRHRVLEGVEDEGLPVGEGPDQVRVGVSHLGQHSLAPSLVSCDGSLWAT